MPAAARVPVRGPPVRPLVRGHPATAAAAPVEAAAAAVQDLLRSEVDPAGVHQVVHRPRLARGHLLQSGWHCHRGHQGVGQGAPHSVATHDWSVDQVVLVHDILVLFVVVIVVLALAAVVVVIVVIVLFVLVFLVDYDYVYLLDVN